MTQSLNTFDRYAKYYDLLNSDKNYKEEVDHIHNILFKNNLNKVNILDLGSGTGKHACLLASKGHIVYGIEQSNSMIEHGSKNVNYTCLRGDIRTFSLDKVFQVVISLFHVMSYQVSDDDLEKVFINVSKHLNSGGFFIFDFWYLNGVLNLKPTNRTKIFKDDLKEIERYAEPRHFLDNNLVEVNYTFVLKDLINQKTEQFKESHLMRYFSVEELIAIAKKFKFQVQQITQSYTDHALTDDSWSGMAILRKQ